MIRTNYLVLIIVVVLSSCSLSTSQNYNPRKSLSFEIDEKALNDGILRISLPPLVPKNMAIQSPTGEWFVLQDSDESIEFMPQDRFESTKFMEFQLNELKGVTWRESAKVIDKVFQSTGTYLIYFADNLETEPENTFSLQKSITLKKQH